MADQAMSAVDYLVLGFLLLGSRHNEVAMSRRHERRPGGPIKYSRYISELDTKLTIFNKQNNKRE